MRGITKEDIEFFKIYPRCPEQYEVTDKKGNILGYARVRWGFFIVWCPDECSNDEVYSAKIGSLMWEFPNDEARKYHIEKAKSKVVDWYGEKTKP